MVTAETFILTKSDTYLGTPAHRKEKDREKMKPKQKIVKIHLIRNTIGGWKARKMLARIRAG